MRRVVVAVAVGLVGCQLGRVDEGPGSAEPEVANPPAEARDEVHGEPPCVRNMRWDCEALGGRLYTYLSMPPQYRCLGPDDHALFDARRYCRSPRCVETDTQTVGDTDPGVAARLERIVGRRRFRAVLLPPARGTWGADPRAERVLELELTRRSTPVLRTSERVVPRTDGVPDFDPTLRCEPTYEVELELRLSGVDVDVRVPVLLRWAAGEPTDAPTRTHLLAELPLWRLDPDARRLPDEVQTDGWETLVVSLGLSTSGPRGSVSLTRPPRQRPGRGVVAPPTLEVLRWPP